MSFISKLIWGSSTNTESNDDIDLEGGVTGADVDADANTNVTPNVDLEGGGVDTDTNTNGSSLAIPHTPLKPKRTQTIERVSCEPRFTSTRCPHFVPSVEGESATCEVPFGVLVSPMAPPPPSHSEGESEQQQPVLCLTCCAYLNLYSTMSAGEGVMVWKCPFCESETNAAPSSLLPCHDKMSPLTQPLMEFRQPIPKQQRKASGCAYVFVVDENLGPTELMSLGDTIRGLTDPKESFLKDGDVIGLITFGSSVSVYQVGLHGIASADVFPCQEDNAEGHEGEEKDAAYAARTYYNVTDERNYLARVATTTATTTNGMNMGSFLSCLSAAAGRHTTTDSSIHSSGKEGGRREQLRLRRLRRKKQQQNNNEHPTSASSSFQQRRRQTQQQAAIPTRCTGTALWHAVNLVTLSASSSPSHHNCRTGRVLLFTNGCPNAGVGSVVIPPNDSTAAMNNPVSEATFANGLSKLIRDARFRSQHVDAFMLENACDYYEELAVQSFAEFGIGLDVFCAGTTPLGLKAMQSLVSPSGGYALPHTSFATTQFQRNLKHLLCNTHMSKSYVTSTIGNPSGSSTDQVAGTDIDNNDLHNGNNMHINKKADEQIDPLLKLNGCIVDIRMSPFVQPTRIIAESASENYQTHNNSNDNSNYTSKQNHSKSRVLPNEQAVYAKCASLAALHSLPTANLPSDSHIESSRTRLHLGRFDPLSTLSIQMEVVDDDIKAAEDNANEKDAESGTDHQERQYAYFQFVTRCVNSQGTELITRVFTHRMTLSTSVHDFLDGVQEDILPVLLAKEAVLRCVLGGSGRMSYGSSGGSSSSATSTGLYSGNEEEETSSEVARRDLDATVNRISRAYRLLGMSSHLSDLISQDSDAMMRHQSSFQFAFPPELADMLKLLHHLRRGSLLNASLLSVDDRCSLRALFLRLPHQECHLMLSPVVFSTRVNTVCPADPPNLLIELEEVPPQTLALWDDVVIAADHFDALFVWSGKSLNNCHTIIDRSNTYDTIRQDSRDFLLQATSHRFPAPTLYNLEEGESMSRRLTSRLAPSHVDPPEQQLAHFEKLSLLTSDELHRLRNKFRFCNDTSGDTSFRKWFWDVVSATSKVAKDGQSLTL
eukprot:CAMPEP_0194366936 /NCGR_PEP_ID=MMETSP0174-20130528/15053_1 /TAXON_ID=216777 /ORGANISM="Proboscia alata, Strain PI-D3" /LENGTH=1108 /DNA_ID=CAMNT_0039142453 /DNA_START=48 /DNA_END=3374 /DNA_ORIENTATION=+